MANLTASKADERQEGVLIDVALAAVKLFKGSNVSFNAAGYAKGSSDTTGEAFAGVSLETVDNSAGAAGDKYVRIWREGVSSMGCVSATQAWVGQDVYAVDDNLVALAATTTNDVKVGKCVGFVSATEVRVKI
ncbi:hypothetical protein [Arthrobacter sp. EpRS71]|uniref:hypothetical protein n=1 Tax=Arthrobacter sp. EpRS71 TaxID=1743141 RepID=UPI0007482125|nr:hypothetical protein [Arthrobacter sp. EpRS71]KUM39010.1 hypothetical protein AR689_07600 [Arthrobacter sp. EpRS71]